MRPDHAAQLAMGRDDKLAPNTCSAVSRTDAMRLAATMAADMACSRAVRAAIPIRRPLAHERGDVGALVVGHCIRQVTYRRLVEPGRSWT